MRHRIYVLAAAATAIGLVAACSGSHDASTGSTASATSGDTITTTVSQATTTASATDLQSLIPAPANTQRTDGPRSIHDSGIHMHFMVNGSPADVMNAYKTALEGKNWSLTVESSGGGGGGGGATYTGTNGAAYGVFTGGGYADTTDIDACVWSSKPSTTHCAEGHH
jgi:hypothetical protein